MSNSRSISRTLSKSLSVNQVRGEPVDPVVRLTRAAVALLTVLHFAFIALLRDRVPAVFFELPLLGVVVWLAASRRVVPELALCHANICLWLLLEPSVGFFWPAWFAFVPLFLVAVREKRFWRLAGWGLWTGVMVVAGIYAWLWQSIQSFLLVNAIVALPMFLTLVAAIGVQYAIFLPLAGFVWRCLKLPCAVTIPLVYTVVEYWMPLPLPIAMGMVFTQQPVFLQPLEIVGLPGVSLLVAVANGALLDALLSFRDKRIRRMTAGIGVAVAIIVAHFAFGLWRMRVFADPPDAPSIDVAMIQPMSPLRVMNSDHEMQERIAEKLTSMSLEVCGLGGKRPDLLIWPEAAASFAARTPEFNPAFMRALTKIREEAGVPLVAHNVEFVMLPGAAKPRYHSAISLIEPDGQVVASYRKNILMPFGEYLPFERAFPVLRKWFPQARTVLPGVDAVPIDGPGGRFAPLICFEILFPDYARRLVAKDCGYIMNLTNDRWYGARQQPVQHLSFAALRAIENRKPVVRATNSGISALIDARGVIAPGAGSGTMRDSVLRGRIVPRREHTFYGRHGDLVHPYVLTPWVLGMLALAWFRKRGEPAAAGTAHVDAPRRRRTARTGKCAR
jgi:apolipoprotein N-acyltransferase